MKNAAKKLKVRNIIFSQTCISRQDLLRSSGLSIRALDRYIADLLKDNLISRDVHSGKRGRSSYFYRSNSEKIIFPGLSLIQSKFSLVVLDINAYIIYAKTVDFPENIVSADLIQLGLGMLEEVRKILPDRNMAAIAFNFNTFQQPSNRFTVMKELMRKSGRQFRVETRLFESSSLNLLRFYTVLGWTGSVGMPIFGDRIRLHVVTDGEIRSDLDNFLYGFKHRQIDPKSKWVCPHCRKPGCIDVLLTYRAVVRRYQDISASVLPCQFDQVLYNNIQLLGDSGEPAARRILEENGVLIARAMAILRKDLQLDHLVISNCPKIQYDIFTAAYHDLTGNGKPVLNLRSLSVSDAILAAPDLMRREILGYSKP